MDRDHLASERLLPATAWMCSEFEAVYRRRFPADDPFWTEFERHWAATADAALADAAADSIDAATFRSTAAAKVRAACIPLAATARAQGRPCIPVPWQELAQALGEWHQLRNDFIDWRRDSERGYRSYLLSEAERRRADDEPVATWMAREGLAWGLSELDGRLDAARTLALESGSRAALDYVDGQRRELDGLRASLGAGRDLIAVLLDSAR